MFLRPKITIAFASLILLYASIARSQSFGVIGEVFPVEEMSFLELIHMRLNALTQGGDLDRIQDAWKSKMSAHIARPRPLSLGQAHKNSTHYFRPEVVLDTDINDAQGKVIYPAGIKTNALQQLPHYSPCWLFLNSDLKGEAQWAKKEMQNCANPKIILTGGAIHDMEQFLNTAIYFDQGGILTQKLKIRSLPARVIRGTFPNQDALQIEEIAIKENGDVL